MKNETLERLRLPGAWVLIGAVGASMLSGLIGLISGSSYPGSFASAMNGAAGSFFGLGVVVLLAVAVALVLTSERTRPSAQPIVLVAMVMSGVGLLFALVNLITEFVWAAEVDSMGSGFAGFVSTLGSGAVLGILGFALLKIFNDPTLIPRAAPQQGVYPQQYPPATGAQQSFAQPAYPAQDAYGQPVVDPNQTGSGQQYGVDPAAQQQAAYGQQAYDPAQQAYDPSQQQYGTGAQQAYGAAYGTDPAQQYGTGAQQGYGQQYGTDASGQQAAYGQQGEYAYDPSQYAPQGTEQQPAAGEQAAQDAIQYGWYQGADQGQPGQQAQNTPSEGNLDPFFNSGENTGTQTPGQGGGAYGDQYGTGAGYGSDQQGQSGTGGQQGWYGNEDQR